MSLLPTVTGQKVFQWAIQTHMTVQNFPVMGGECILDSAQPPLSLMSASSGVSAGHVQLGSPSALHSNACNIVNRHQVLQLQYCIVFRLSIGGWG